MTTSSTYCPRKGYLTGVPSKEQVVSLEIDKPIIWIGDYRTQINTELSSSFSFVLDTELYSGVLVGMHVCVSGGGCMCV